MAGYGAWGAQAAAAWGQQAAQQAAQAWAAQAAQQGAQQQQLAAHQAAQQAAWQQAALQQQPQQAQQQQVAQPQANGKKFAYSVAGCTHDTVGPIVRGSFELVGENHGKPTYKKDGQVNGLDVMTYFWDERDGEGFCGWWFGPKVGGDQVWAYHADKTSQTPPLSGWKVPYDGPVDETLVLTATPKEAAGDQQAQQQQQQQQQWNQGQWSQQQQQAWAQQQMQMQQMQAKMQNPALQQQQMQQLQLMQQQRLQMQQQQMQAGQAQGWQQQQQQQQWGQQQQLSPEAQKARAEAQMKQIEEMKEKQRAMKAEADKKRAEAMEAKKTEQVAVLQILRVLQRYKNVMPNQQDEVKKELDEAIAQHIDACGSQREKLTREIEQTLAQAQQRIQKLAEYKAAEQARQKEAAEQASKMMKEFEEMIEKAEEVTKGAVEEAEPLKGDKPMTGSEIETCAAAVDQAVKDANLAVQVATDYATKESANVKKLLSTSGEPATGALADLAKLMARLNTAKKTTMRTLVECNNAKTTLVKKAHAKEKFDAVFAVFKKYEKDGTLGRRQIQKLAQGEYGFSLPSQALDKILQVLVKDGEKGVSKDDCPSLKSMIGIAREVAMDEKRREAKAEREKVIAEKAAKLKADIKKVEDLVTSTAETIGTAEKQSDVVAGSAKAKTMTAEEMFASADESDSAIKEGKAAVAKAKESVASLTCEDDAEVKAILAAAVTKIEASIKVLDLRIQKSGDTVAKWRQAAQRKANAELDKLCSESIAMMYRYMGEKKLDGDGMFKAIDKNKNGTIEEDEFLKFFKANLKTIGEAADATALADADVKRLFAYLDNGGSGSLSKEEFLSTIRKFMKASKASVITEDISIKSKILRRLDEGEVFEIIMGPIKEDLVDVARLRVKALKDGVDGWVTPIGNQGTVFLEDGGNLFKVVKETILTDSFVIGGDSKTKDRKLKVGEICEARVWPRKDEASGLTRMKVRVQSDSEIGWVTSVGNTGTAFLEIM